MRLVRSDLNCMTPALDLGLEPWTGDFQRNTTSIGLPEMRFPSYERTHLYEAFGVFINWPVVDTTSPTTFLLNIFILPLTTTNTKLHEHNLLLCIIRQT